jgi:hypothetical protein
VSALAHLPEGLTPTGIPGLYNRLAYRLGGVDFYETVSAWSVRSVPDYVNPPESHKALVRRVLPHKGVPS